MLLEFILFLERPILFCLMDIYIWGSWPPGKRIKNSAFDSTDWKSCMRTLWNSLNLDLRVIDGFDEQLGSNYQLNATIQYPFGKLGKPTNLAKLLQQNIKFTRQSKQCGFCIYIFDQSKSMVRLVRAEKMVLTGLVFARKIARMILIQNI